jgi:hypothetical protein
MEHRLKKKLSSEYARIARKASYWQKSYDEWKKYGATYPDFRLSQLLNDDLLQRYMDKGWGTITDIYKKKILDKDIKKLRVTGNSYTKAVSKRRLSVEFDTKPLEQQELILGILGSIRKYMVQTIFSHCENDLKTKHLNEITFSGSENITSDFDVSILGPEGNKVMWKMFMTFLAKYEDALPEAFDTNLYSSPLYIHKSKRFHKNIICKSHQDLPHRIDFGERFFTLFPSCKKDLEVELTWACVKLLHISKVSTIPKILQDYFRQAIKYKMAMEKISKSMDKDPIYLELSLQNNLHPANTIKNSTKNVIKKYYLQYLWQKPIHKFMYSGPENKKFIKQPIMLDENIFPEKNLFFYANIANYFSSDAYYTSSSVNAIVIETQKKIKLDFKNKPYYLVQGMYLVSAIENFGDFLNHIKESYLALEISKEKDKDMQLNNIKTILIKYSKYLHRVYYSIGKTGNQLYQKKAVNLKKYVLPFRKDYDIENADKMLVFAYMDYSNQIDINLYLELIQKKVLYNISLILKEVFKF